MGFGASKAARTAAGASIRKYPSRPPAAVRAAPPNAAPAPTQPVSPGPKVHPPPHASSTRDEAINLDASDPDFARNLRTIGPVTPMTTFSNSSTFAPPLPASHSSSSAASSAPAPHLYPDPSANSALVTLAARERIQHAAEDELGRMGRGLKDREFLDVVIIRQILMLRDKQNMADGEIEQRLGLKSGLVKKLGVRGMIEPL